MTTVAIHQPNYLPWSGFFAKLARADVFVLLDTVPFTKNSWQNRVQVKGAAGPIWLTQPVLTSGRSGQATRDVEFPPDDPWRVKHVKTLDACYARSPHYEEVFGAIADLYRGHETRLAPFNEALIGRITDYLGIPTPIRRASELGGVGTATDLLVDLVRKAGGDTYLSGQGGRRIVDCIRPRLRPEPPATAAAARDPAVEGPVLGFRVDLPTFSRPSACSGSTDPSAFAF